jgi:hypothetical protein
MEIWTSIPKSCNNIMLQSRRKKTINNIKMGLALVLLCACNKYKAPYINIITPREGQVFSAPATIEIRAEISDSDAVTSEYLVVTKENATNDTIINFKEYQFSPGTYYLLKSFVSEPNTRYKIVVSAVGHSHLAGDTVRVKTF